MGTSDTTYAAAKTVKRLQGSGAYADEHITVATKPDKPIHELGGAADTTPADKNGNQVYTNADGSAKFQPIVLANYVKKNAAGEWIIDVPRAAWMNHADTCQHKDGVGHTGNACRDELYVVSATFHLPGFAAQVVDGDKAFVDVYGVPTRATVMALNGEFSTEYKTESWNRNVNSRTIDGDYAKMLPLTAEPELKTFFNWTGGKTAESNLETDPVTHRPLTHSQLTGDDGATVTVPSLIEGTLDYTVTRALPLGRGQLREHRRRWQAGVRRRQPPRGRLVRVHFGEPLEVYGHRWLCGPGAERHDVYDRPHGPGARDPRLHGRAPGDRRLLPLRRGR